MIISAGGLSAEVFCRGGEAGDTPTVLLITGGESIRGIWEKYAALSDRPCRLAAVAVEDWENALSPWRAGKVFKGGSDFGDGADGTAEMLERELVPELRRAFDIKEGRFYIAGYSLAGLFAIYALYRTEVFSGAISASGSLWFPGFAEFTAAHEPLRRPNRMYFSLGDKEKNTKNPVMSRVEEKTKEISERFVEARIECVFRSEPGGHFADAEGRIARGMAWLTDDRE
ncbi:MAG: alpha/beta hydrolase [Oscillospiraceae bacterium]|nr:alpha/beta hydrolase [Oscillospiraceae bacterium]